MTGEQFVKLCYEEKKTILAEYFNPNSSSVVGKKISAITVYQKMICMIY